jgi:hypothetical protein
MKPALTIETLAEVLAAAWAYALLGKESVERDSVLRELQRDHLTASSKRPRLRLVRNPCKPC